MRYLTAFLVLVLAAPVLAGTPGDAEFAFTQFLVFNGDLCNAACTLNSDIDGTTRAQNGWDIWPGDTVAVHYRAWSSAGGVEYTLTWQERAHGHQLTTTNAETAGNNVTIELTESGSWNGQPSTTAFFSVGDLIRIRDGTTSESTTIETIDTSADTIVVDIVSNHAAGSTVELEFVAPESGSAIVSGETDEESHVASLSVPLAGQARIVVTGGAGNSADTKVVIRCMEQ